MSVSYYSPALGVVEFVRSVKWSEPSSFDGLGVRFAEELLVSSVALY